MQEENDVLEVPRPTYSLYVYVCMYVCLRAYVSAYVRIFECVRSFVFVCACYVTVTLSACGCMLTRILYAHSPFSSQHYACVNISYLCRPVL
ncbi:hypothetical protein NP493_86g01029 [Ridgeia piscesae]|uniref:Uncharacterized protein n=1 Tax=Ridgeia piscesae TaxID=27915 RepID=A0AAD9P8I1_RIDPI|nr:hypothetical protein NP493_86g01029 [Ridgeia piscesae]